MLEVGKFVININKFHQLNFQKLNKSSSVLWSYVFKIFTSFKYKGLLFYLLILLGIFESLENNNFIKYVKIILIAYSYIYFYFMTYF